MRGVFLQEGAHKWLVRTVYVSEFLEPLKEDEAPEPLDPSSKQFLRRHDTLETALRTFDASGATRLPVVDPAVDPTKIIGHASHVRALRYFNSALVDAHAEEHR